MVLFDTPSCFRALDRGLDEAIPAWVNRSASVGAKVLPIRFPAPHSHTPHVGQGLGAGASDT